MKTRIPLLLLALSLSAYAQVELGTLVVLNASTNEIVVAGDSRSYDKITGYADDRCKITALGKMIFAASGNTAYGPNRGHLIWDSHVIARKEFKRIQRKRTAEPIPIQLANSWGPKVAKELRSNLIHDRQGLFLPPVGNELIAAVFTSFINGVPLTVTAKVTYDIPATGRPQTHFAITDVYEGPKAVMLGHTELAKELFDGKTARAVAWRRGVSGSDLNASAVISAVQFSIDHYPLVNIDGKMVATIGGSIDAVKLSLGSDAQWIQRKPSCPAD